MLVDICHYLISSYYLPLNIVFKSKEIELKKKKIFFGVTSENDSMEWELGKRQGGGLVRRGRRGVWEAEGEVPGSVGVGFPLMRFTGQWGPLVPRTQFPGASLHSVCVSFFASRENGLPPS